MWWVDLLREPSGTWVATVPGLRGVEARARTRAAAMAQAVEQAKQHTPEDPITPTHPRKTRARRRH